MDKKQHGLANVSHELLRQMTLLLGSLNRSLSQIKTSQPRDASQMMRRNGYRLLRMMEQLLINKALAIRPVVTSSSDVAGIVKAFQKLASENGIALTLSRLDPMRLAITPGALEKIMFYLLSNAIKYTLHGGRIELCCMNQGEQALLIVSGTGIGIAPDEQQRIFAGSHRLLAEHSEWMTGTGVGLALVKELVEHYQGTLSVQSGLGQGAVFSVCLPLLADAEDNQTTTVLESDSVLLAAELENQKEQELALEAANQTKSFKQIQESGASASTAGPEELLTVDGNPVIHTFIAQASAQDKVPDLIISDAVMPGMGGFELTRRDDHSRLRSDALSADALSSEQTPRKLKSEISPRDQKFIDRFHTMIEQHYTNPELGIAAMTHLLALSERPLQRKVKALFGQTPKEYLRTYRLHQARKLLKSDDMQVAQIAENVGITNHSYFATCFKAQFGVSPSDYRHTASQYIE